MPHLFFSVPDGDWQATPLDGDSFALTESEGALRVERVTEVAVEHTASVSSVLLIEAERGDAPARHWVALACGDVALNGNPLRAGIAVVSDRDELRVGRQRAYVSFEQRAEIETYEQEDEPQCSRCRGAIERAQRFVRCPSPNCQCLAHQDEAQELPCWLVTGNCPVCGGPTALDADFAFAPELL